MAKDRFSSLDLHFAAMLERLAREQAEDDLQVHSAGQLATVAAMVSKQRGRGHACLRLDDLAGQAQLSGDAVLEDASQLRRVLRASPLVAVEPDLHTPPRPLVIDHQDRVYLWRYFAAEQRLAERFRRLIPEGGSINPTPELRDLFNQLFPETGDINRQAVAAAVALSSPLTLVSGGPGTGKTTTVVRLLAMLRAAQPQARIALAAPTGKAAHRLEESISEQLSVDALAEFASTLPTAASTLHRLLNYSPRTDTFRFSSDRSLPYEIIIVDEASMVDLLMMDCLGQALAEGARLVLLGDRDQLASVDTGFVFGDLCAVAELGMEQLPSGVYDRLARWRSADSASPPLTEPTKSPWSSLGVELRTSYRFRDQPGIGELATAVREGDADRALGALDSLRFDDIERHSHTDPPITVLAPVADALARVVTADSPEAALTELASFRILCPTRVGFWGSERMNTLAELILRDQGHGVDNVFYPGRPILVESNDYQVQLWNGDLGICWRDEGQLWAFFTTAQGMRRIPLARVPPHATAWAMTVHKSQGSEVDHVLLVLPEKDHDLLSRELVYTGITRARQKIDVVSSPMVLEAALGRSSRRTTGLVDALVGAAP